MGVRYTCTLNAKDAYGNTVLTTNDTFVVTLVPADTSSVSLASIGACAVRSVAGVGTELLTSVETRAHRRAGFLRVEQGRERTTLRRP